MAEDSSDLGSPTTPNDNVKANSFLLLVRYVALLNSSEQTFHLILTVTLYNLKC